MPGQNPTPLTPPPGEELARGSIEARPLPSVATAANSTTLKDIERKARINKAIVIALSSLATVALAFNIWAPWNLVASTLLFVLAVIVAFFTNALTPEELDALLARLSKSSETAAHKAEEKTKEGDR